MDCPRCDQKGSIRFFEAPEDQSWKMYRCPHCDFVWRDTELKKGKDFPPEFKLTPEQIEKLAVKPMIPPLRILENGSSGSKR